MSGLFDEFQRTDTARASRLEPEYDWWNRSARPEVSAAREELERWFHRYPRAEREGLRQRFRSEDDDAHSSALFELFIQEQLCRAGFRVKCHPNMPRSRRSPDFLVCQDGQPRFYVEAVLAGSSAEEKRAERLKDAAIEVVDSIRSRDFWVSVLVSGRATAPLPLRKKRLRPGILAWIEQVQRQLQISTYVPGSRRALPSFEWEASGLGLVLRATPKPPGTASDRLLASETQEVVFQPAGNRQIEGAFAKKATRYGPMDLPYFVAINVLEVGVDSDDVDLALERSWGTPTHPKNRRVSGVLLATVWNPISAVNRQLEAVLNPSARNAVDPSNLPFRPFSGVIRW